MVHLLEERVNVSPLTTSETVVVARLWPNVKAGTALIMKRTQALHGTDPRRLESHVIADDIGNIDALAHLIDVFTLNQPRHRLSLVTDRSVRRGTVENYASWRRS
jgi:hypothetical protein